MKNDNVSTKERLSQKDLAERWAISQRTLEKWRGRGVGPCYLKIVGKIVYRIEDIEAYENKCLRCII